MNKKNPEVKEKRNGWGDPKWHMRRAVMLGVFVFCAFLPIYALHYPADRIQAMGSLLTPLSLIVMPVLLAYLGIPEYSAWKAQPQQPPKPEPEPKPEAETTTVSVTNKKG